MFSESPKWLLRNALSFYEHILGQILLPHQAQSIAMTSKSAATLLMCSTAALTRFDSHSQPSHLIYARVCVCV